MASETKIGLLVGLAFIVCFALILSHRGGGDRLSNEMAYQLLNRHRQATASAGVFQTANRSSSFSMPNVVAASILPTLATGQAGRSIERELVAATEPLKWSFSSNEPSIEESEVVAVAAVDAKPPKNTILSGFNAISTTFESLFGASPAVPADSPKLPPTTTGDKGDEGSRNLASNRARYVVKPGDTLWAIAAKSYGRRTRLVVDTIYAANQTTIKSRDRLLVGSEIILPKIDGRAALVGRPLEQAQPTPKPRYRHYQIRKGDRYATIAQRFLGDRSRWQEIHELNKTMFPDPSKIRYGVRIRLPADAKNG